VCVTSAGRHIRTSTAITSAACNPPIVAAFGHDRSCRVRTILAATIATATAARTASQNIGSSRAKTNSEREKVSGEYLNNSSNTTRPIATPDYGPRAPDQVPGVVGRHPLSGDRTEPPNSRAYLLATLPA